MDTNKLARQLIVDEGLLNRPYRDTVGKLTIGVGRNLDDVGISTAEAYYLLNNDIQRVLNEINQHLPWFSQLNDVRQRVIANMVFNMGFYRFLTFSKTLRFLRDGDYSSAADEMMNSLWAKQTGMRAVRLANMMRSGNDTPTTGEGLS